MSEKAEPKTILELIALHDAWKRTFHRGAMGNRNDYNLARDTRHHFEEELWIPAKGLVAQLQKLVVLADRTRTQARLVYKEKDTSYIPILANDTSLLYDRLKELLARLGVEEIVESVELDYSDFPEGKEVTVLKLKEKQT